MLRKLSPSNEKGFTIIELMVVIAILGILAAIAIPNFIYYRDKSFCSAAESDGNSIAVAMSDYYGDPSHVTLETTVATFLNPLSGPSGNVNTATISGSVTAIVITVTDISGRCPAAYQANQSNWAGGIFTKTM